MVAKVELMDKIMNFTSIGQAEAAKPMRRQGKRWLGVGPPRFQANVRCQAPNIPQTHQLVFAFHLGPGDLLQHGCEIHDDLCNQKRKSLIKCRKELAPIFGGKNWKRAFFCWMLSDFGICCKMRCIKKQWVWLQFKSKEFLSLFTLMLQKINSVITIR